MGVEEFQPTKLSRWIAGVTIPLSVGATQLYEALQKLGQPIESLAETRTRLLLGLGVFSLCMVLLNMAVLAHLRALARITFPPADVPPPVVAAPLPVANAPEHKPLPPIPKRLDDVELDILRHLARFKSSPGSEITKTLRKPKALIDYHLNDLESHGLIYATHGTMYESQWYIDQLGRKALIDRGLLK
jgi:DNA-binding transcriptional ArsR family regulator